MLLRPKLRVEAAYQLDPSWLQQHGIRALLVDLDDTVIAAGREELEPAYRGWFEELKRAGIPTLILSNGEPSRVRFWSETLGIQGLSMVGKPFGFAYRRALQLLGSRPSETAMVGDQLFTDVLGANLAGITSVLVTPLSPGKLCHTRLARRLERLILKGDKHGRPVDRR